MLVLQEQKCLERLCVNCRWHAVKTMKIATAPACTAKHCTTRLCQQQQQQQQQQHLLLLTTTISITTISTTTTISITTDPNAVNVSFKVQLQRKFFTAEYLWISYLYFKYTVCVKLSTKTVII